VPSTPRYNVCFIPWQSEEEQRCSVTLGGPRTCPARTELFSPNQIWGTISDAQYAVPCAALDV